MSVNLSDNQTNIDLGIATTALSIACAADLVAKMLQGVSSSFLSQSVGGVELDTDTLTLLAITIISNKLPEGEGA